MKENGYKKASEVMSIASIVMILIAFLFGLAMIRVGSQNLVAADNVIIDITNFSKTGVETTAHIESIDPINKTVISYTVDGKEYTPTIEVYTDEIAAGTDTTLWYDPEDPTVIRTPDLFISFYKKSGKKTLYLGLLIFGVSAALAVLFLFLAKKFRKIGLRPVIKEN